MSDHVTLLSLGYGAAEELFNQELDKVLRNIADPNTRAIEVRRIQLDVKIKPSADRSYAEVEMKASSKLAGHKVFTTAIHVGIQDGRLIATNSHVDQAGLPLEESKEGTE